MAKSKSFQGLLSHIQDVTDLDDLVLLKTQGSKGPTTGINAARRAAVLLLNAHFEAFLEDLMDEALQHLTEGLDTSVLRRNFTTPRTNNIDKFFSLLGISKISSQISWQGANNSTVRKAIDELQDTRNKIAHGDPEAKATKRDVVRLTKYVVGFSEKADDVVATRLEEMTGKRPW